jgi:hypothetical protein
MWSGGREGGHVRRDRIRPLLEQDRQILVPYRPQGEPHQTEVCPGRSKEARITTWVWSELLVAA